MRPRVLAGLLVAAAALAHLGFTLPARSRSRLAALELRRVLGAQQDARAQLAAAQRRHASRVRALEAVAESAAPREEALADTRRMLVEAASGAGVSDLRLSLRPGVAPVTAVVRVSARGSFDQAMRLSALLLEPRRGLVVEQARFRPSVSGVDLELMLLRPGNVR